QQQRLLPGQRDLLVRLGAYGPQPAGLRRAAGGVPARASRLPPPPLVPGAPDPRRGADRHRLVPPRRPADDGRGLAQRLREVARRLPEWGRDRLAGPAGPAGPRRLVLHPLQRGRGADPLRAAQGRIRPALDADARHRGPPPALLRRRRPGAGVGALPGRAEEGHVGATWRSAVDRCPANLEHSPAAAPLDCAWTGASAGGGTLRRHSAWSVRA